MLKTKKILSINSAINIIFKPVKNPVLYNILQLVQACGSKLSSGVFGTVVTVPKTACQLEAGPISATHADGIPTVFKGLCGNKTCDKDN